MTVAVVLLVAGLMALAVGAQEVRTDAPAIARLGGNRTPRRDGWILVSIGTGMVFVAIVLLLGLPDWVMLVVVFAAVAGMLAAFFTYRPRERLGRKVDPPSDPDAVWKRNPPGY